MCGNAITRFRAAVSCFIDSCAFAFATGATVLAGGGVPYDLLVTSLGEVPLMGWDGELTKMGVEGGRESAGKAA